jgi:polar amino acid transport system substrate-binding protein
MNYVVNSRLYPLIIILAILFVPVQVSAQNTPLEKVTLRLVWKHQFQFAGYYMAIHKGFYAKRGLDVDIIECDLEINNLKAVTTGETEFAVGRSSLLIDMARGANIVALFAAYQHSPFMLLSKAFNGIDKPADLRGKHIMLTPDAASSGELITMLLNAGLSKKDYISQPHSYNVDDLINGNTDALASYVSNEPYKMIQQGLPYSILHPADYGFDMYADILFTSAKMAKEKPVLVDNFYEASIEGWKYAFANITETVSIIHQFYNSQNRSREALLFEAQELKKLAFDERKNFGTLLPHRFRSMTQIYLLAGIIDKAPKLDKFIYKPPVGKLNLTYDELEYIKDKQVLNICIQKNWLPYENIQGNNYQGILADFSHLVRDKAGLSMYPIATDSSQQALTLTLQGICDLTTAATYQTGRNNLLLFSEAYINIPLVYVSQKPVNDINPIKTTVAISTSSPYYNIILRNKKHYTFIETGSSLESLKMLQEGSVDALIGSQAHIKFLLADNKISGFNLSDYNLGNLKTSFAMNHQHQVLLSILNKTLEIITPKDRDKIMSQWIITVQPQSISNKIYIFLIGVITLFSLFILYRYFSTLIRSNILKELSETDQLTNISNRRKALEDIQRHIDLSNRYSHHLSLIYFDIDNFKIINDHYGHKTGDYVLSELADLIKKHIRKTDSFGRWGGEEFIISSPESSLDDTNKMASILKTEIQQHDFKLQKKVTCSFGITSYQKGESLDSFINRADKAMYRAKHSGKDCIVILQSKSNES